MSHKSGQKLIVDTSDRTSLPHGSLPRRDVPTLPHRYRFAPPPSCAVDG